MRPRVAGSNPTGVVLAGGNICPLKPPALRGRVLLADGGTRAERGRHKEKPRKLEGLNEHNHGYQREYCCGGSNHDCVVAIEE